MDVANEGTRSLRFLEFAAASGQYWTVLNGNG
jgi:hypothetical protein